MEVLLLEQAVAPPRSRLARLVGRSPLAANKRASYVGAKGNIVVGALLATLPAEWAVFHALPFNTPAADIDHLVVGPGGIFTISTMHHGGKSVSVGGTTLTVAGQAAPDIRRAELEAERVTRLMQERMPLLPPVQPVIALVDPSRLTICERPDQVHVLDARNLGRWLLTLQPVLTEGEVLEVVELVDSPEAWHSPPEITPGDVMAGFAALDLEVRRARARRVFLAVLGVAVIAGVAAVVLSQFAAPLAALFGNADG